MRDLVLLAFWMTAVPLSLICPPAGVVFWLWDAILSPTELMYSFMTGIPTNKIAALVTVFGLFSDQERRDLYWDKTLTVLLVLAMCASASYLGSISRDAGDDYLYWKLLKEEALVVFICWLLYDRRWLEVAVFGVVIAISFLGVKEGLISLLTVGGHQIVGSRALGDNNQLAAMLVSTLPLVYYLYQYVANRYLRFGLLGVMVLNVTTVIMTFSRGGFVGLVCVSLLMLKGSRHRFRTAILLVALAAGVYILAPATWFSRVSTIETADSDGSFMGRVIAWKLSWLIAQDNPIFGGGPHAIQHWDVWTHYIADFKQLDFIPTPFPDVAPHAAHSIYFEVLGDLGWSGVLTYALLLIFAFLNCRRMKREGAKDAASAWAADLGSYLQISLVAYLITGALLSIAYQELLFVLVGFASRGARTSLRASKNCADDRRVVIDSELPRALVKARF